ncbi:MAG: DinB family protein [Bacteroidota bacterium]
MAKLLLTPENQIQRLNQLLNFVQSLEELSLSQLSKKPSDPSWNTLEVLEHLSIAYSLYEEKITKALVKAPDTDDGVWEYQPGFWNRFVIEGQRPKGKKRPFKMKTLKRFEPQLPKVVSQQDAEKVFERFNQSHSELKKFILESRNKQVNHQRISSAIGPIVKFHLPEAFEFLICHMERHRVQIEGILAS